MTAAKSPGLAAAAALVLALAACSSTAEPGGGPSPTTTGPGSVTSTETGTTAPTAAAPSTPAPTGSGGETGAPTVEPIPTDAVDYADALIVAWGVGDTARMEQLAVPQVLEVLGDSGGPNWERVGADSGAGSTFVTYEDSETAATLELRVQIQTASNGDEHAVVEAKRNQ